MIPSPPLPCAETCCRLAAPAHLLHAAPATLARRKRIHTLRSSCSRPKTQQTLRSRPLTRLNTRPFRPRLNPAVSPARWCRPRAPTVRSRIKCGCTRDIHRASRQNSRPTSVAALQTAPSAFPPKAGSAARCCQPRCSRYASGCCVAEPLTLTVLAAIAAGRRVIRTCKPPVTPTLFVPAENRGAACYSGLRGSSVYCAYTLAALTRL